MSFAPIFVYKNLNFAPAFQQKEREVSKAASCKITVIRSFFGKRFGNG
jgi:hypothetical protein